MAGSPKLGNESLDSTKGGKMALVGIIIISKADYSSTFTAEIENKTL